jgi:putative heme-binding domain-containing protein
VTRYGVLIFAALSVNAQGLADGKRMFMDQCARCHGEGGEGGRGPALKSALPDRELFAIVRAGIPDTEMPSFAGRTNEELSQLVAFVQTLGQHTGVTEVFRGDAAAGKPVFASEGCGVCHVIEGAGNPVGPDLSRAGWRSARFLKESIINPDAYVPAQYRGVSVRTTAGATVRGILVAEDESSVQLRDMSGKSRSFAKAQLKSVQHETSSMMPAYTMPSTDMDNLVAYLISLKGKE